MPVATVDAGTDAGAPGLDAPVRPDAPETFDAPDAAELDGGDMDVGESADGGEANDAAEAVDAAMDAPVSDTTDAPRPTLDVAFDASGCGTVVTEFPPVPSPHVTACDPVTYGSSPPTSGPHYPSWPAFGPYSTPIPWGFLVHGLEHGAIVVTYDCPSGCAAEVSSLLTFLELRPEDPLCSREVHHRVIVAPDPTLGVRFAVSAWGWNLTSDCFDLPALGAFMDAHYAMGPENFCADGVTGLSCAPDAGAGDAGP